MFYFESTEEAPVFPLKIVCPHTGHSLSLQSQPGAATATSDRVGGINSNLCNVNVSTGADC